MQNERKEVYYIQHPENKSKTRDAPHKTLVDIHYAIIIIVVNDTAQR